ncbi:unnamed protein product [Prorocentrum cordatum]|uniref:Uncharacterized protein n=1 Tax=Prorocentrum cordatum TaxID=2364126 RepID=A0ABN9Y9J0_9DINO|nr:unnamed protein product [Polarella glacialis]
MVTTTPRAHLSSRCGVAPRGWKGQGGGRGEGRKEGGRKGKRRGERGCGSSAPPGRKCVRRVKRHAQTGRQLGRPARRGQLSSLGLPPPEEDEVHADRGRGRTEKPRTPRTSFFLNLGLRQAQQPPRPLLLLARGTSAARPRRPRPRVCPAPSWPGQGGMYTPIPGGQRGTDTRSTSASEPFGERGGGGEGEEERGGGDTSSPSAGLRHKGGTDTHRYSPDLSGGAF